MRKSLELKNEKLIEGTKTEQPNLNKIYGSVSLCCINQTSSDRGHFRFKTEPLIKTNKIRQEAS